MVIFLPLFLTLILLEGLRGGRSKRNPSVATLPVTPSSWQVQAALRARQDLRTHILDFHIWEQQLAAGKTRQAPSMAALPVTASSWQVHAALTPRPDRR